MTATKCDVTKCENPKHPLDNYWCSHHRYAWLDVIALAGYKDNPNIPEQDVTLLKEEFDTKGPEYCIKMLRGI